MWIATDTGFVSVVQHNQNKAMLLVRARVKADLEALRAPCLKHRFKLKIESDPKADYHWRAIIPRHVFADIMRDKVMELDYTSHFKDVALERSANNPARRSAYYKTWDAMMDMQDAELDPKGWGGWNTGKKQGPGFKYGSWHDWEMDADGYDYGDDGEPFPPWVPDQKGRWW